MTSPESDSETGNSYSSEGFVSLTKLVRDQYVKYLERHLKENLRNWRQKYSDEKELGIEMEAKIKQSVAELELKAIEACMMSQVYQRTMMKIVSNVRRDTQNKRLEKTLQRMFDDDYSTTASDKILNSRKYFNGSNFLVDTAMQTETNTVDTIDIKTENISFEDVDFASNNNNEGDNDKHNFVYFHNNNNDDVTDEDCSYYNNDKCKTPSVQLNIDLFPDKMYEKHLKSTNALFRPPNNRNMPVDTNGITQRKRRRLHYRSHSSEINQQGFTTLNDTIFSSISTTVPSSTPFAMTTTKSSSSPLLCTSKPTEKDKEEGVVLKEQNSLKEDEDFERAVEDDDDDDVGRELALLFADDENDINEIFGITSNGANDDPQMNSILQEIKNAQQNKNNKSHKFRSSNDINVLESKDAYLPEPEVISSSPKISHSSSNSNANISKSIWPCEIYYRKRKLSASLCRLLDNDLRWYDIIKWKFLELFGEDSDDEFAVYSPTIDLDDALIRSCIQRISPWVVQYLMKPLKDGLIANRFLFKKLARKLAYNIIKVNQHPDKEFVKKSIEHFFCIKPSVQSLSDLENV